MMNTEKIGKLISKLRKEKNLTQKQLGDILGVSPKTISKWECGSGLPDTSIIKKIAKELNITTDELLEGNKKSIYNDKHKKHYPVVIIILTVISLIIIIFVYGINNNNTLNENNEKAMCRVIKTYDIDNINRSNDEYYTYITIREFQVEGTYTVKIPIIETNKLQENNGYVFTFNIDKEYAFSTTDNLFEHGQIINVEHTDKIGMERTSEIICN